MAIARDTNSALTSSSAGGGTVTISSYILTATNPILFVGVVNDDDTTSNTTGVTFNSVAMTQVGSKVSFTAGAASCALTMWYIVAQSGTHDIVATRDGTFSARMRSWASSYSGAAQSGTTINPASPGTQNVGTGNISISVTTTVNNSWTILGVADETGGSWSAGSGSTIVGASDIENFFDSNAAITPAGSTTMAATVSVAQNVAGIMIGFAPAVASGPANVKTWDNVTQSTGIKTYGALALASVKSVIGVT